MAKLKDGAFTGSRSHGNPYKGGLEKGIAFDTYEANFNTIKQDGNFPIISKVYRTGSKELIKHLKVKDGWTIADIGSGTATATLELLVQNPGSKVIGFEESEGMYETSLYKCHKSDGKKLLEQVNDKKLLQYWQEFRNESEKYKDQIKFVLGDFLEVNIEPKSIDGAIGSQLVHWIFPEVFEQVHKMLKNGREFIWNSASQFYNDSKFPAAEWGFRYNDFMKYVLESIKERGIEVSDYRKLSRPEHNLKSIKTITRDYGLKTEQIATLLLPVDLQVFVQNHIPAFVRKSVTSKIEPNEFDSITKEAIAEAINNPKALKDVKHKYDIVPIFKSIKV